LIKRKGVDRSSGIQEVHTGSLPYRLYLLLLTFVPMAGLLTSFKQAQKIYAIFGALFIPLLALVLLYLNGRSALVGKSLKNRPLTTTGLALTVAFFLVAFGFKAVKTLQ
jgi:hypothetical protein